jgi:hypothetical protein
MLGDILQLYVLIHGTYTIPMEPGTGHQEYGVSRHEPSKAFLVSHRVLLPRGRGVLTV